VEFPAKPNTRIIVLRVTRFASIIIIRFNPIATKVGDIAIRIARMLFHERVNDEHVNINK
jgi:hypothetical protein